jgi:hypothetical protein
MARINAATKPFDSAKIVTAFPLPVKTVTANEPYQGGRFKVLARKSAMTKFPCSSCHTEKKNAQVQDGAVAAHGSIENNHGSVQNKPTCFMCHDEKERDFLRDAKGTKIDFDHSYQLCGQCHFRQKRDWLGGAHGKREAYWAGERVVRSCTNCHNPHSPAFAKKMPATYSRPLNQKEGL